MILILPDQTWTVTTGSELKLNEMRRGGTCKALRC